MAKNSGGVENSKFEPVLKSIQFKEKGRWVKLLR